MDDCCGCKPRRLSALLSARHSRHGVAARVLGVQLQPVEAREFVPETNLQSLASSYVAVSGPPSGSPARLALAPATQS